MRELQRIIALRLRHQIPERPSHVTVECAVAASLLTIVLLSAVPGVSAPGADLIRMSSAFGR